MWSDNYTPGCLYDTTDCCGCCCEEGRKMFAEYCNEKYSDIVNIKTIKEIRKDKIKKIYDNERIY